MRVYEGSIEDVLASGEYDQGDRVVLNYDELFDLVEQADQFKRLFQDAVYPTDEWDGVPPHEQVEAGIRMVERKTNRPLHPVLGGKSPYSEFLPIGA